MAIVSLFLDCKKATGCMAIYDKRRSWVVTMWMITQSYLNLSYTRRHVRS
jgi:hypothetical protein